VYGSHRRFQNLNKSL